MEMDRSIWTAGRVGAVVMIGIALLLAGCTGDSAENTSDGENGESGGEEDLGELVVEISSSGKIGQFDTVQLSFSSANVLVSGGRTEEIDFEGSVDLTEIPQGGSKEINISEVPKGDYSSIALKLDGIDATRDGSSTNIIGVGGAVGVKKSFSVGGSEAGLSINIQPVPIEDSNKWTLISVPGKG